MKEKLLHALQHSNNKHFQEIWKNKKAEEMTSDMSRKRRKRIIVTVDGREL